MTKDELADHLLTIIAALESGRIKALRVVVVDGDYDAAHTEWSASDAARLVALADNREWLDAQLGVEKRVAAHLQRQ